MIRFLPEIVASVFLIVLALVIPRIEELIRRYKFLSNAYFLASLSFPIALIVSDVVYSLPLNNIIMARVFNIWNSGHLLSWLSVFVVILIFGWRDLFKGITYALLLLASHEIIWYIFFFLGYPQQFFPVITNPHAYMFLLLLGFMIIYVIMYDRKHEKNIVKVAIPLILSEVLYDLIWLSMGYPITLDLLIGKTIYYNSLFVNAVEDVGWILPAIVMIISKYYLDLHKKYLYRLISNKK